MQSDYKKAHLVTLLLLGSLGPVTLRALLDESVLRAGRGELSCVFIVLGAYFTYFLY